MNHGEIVMAKNYPDTDFYAISDKLSYSIRGEVDLIDEIDGGCLQKAVDTAFLRFPYFSVRFVLKDGLYNIDKNPRPHNVIHSKEQIILCSEEVNEHLVVQSLWFPCPRERYSSFPRAASSSRSPAQTDIFI